MDDKHKVTIYLPESVRRELKVYAAQTNRDMSGVVGTAVREYLKRQEAKV